jgi:hypothetical protein
MVVEHSISGPVIEGHRAIQTNQCSPVQEANLQPLTIHHHLVDDNQASAYKAKNQ